MTSNQIVTVFGAFGHTGRFVVSELRNRGSTPILSGRDPDKLNALGEVHAGLDLRPASVAFKIAKTATSPPPPVGVLVVPEINRRTKRP